MYVCVGAARCIYVKYIYTTSLIIGSGYDAKLLGFCCLWQLLAVTRLNFIPRNLYGWVCLQTVVANYKALSYMHVLLRLG